MLLSMLLSTALKTTIHPCMHALADTHLHAESHGSALSTGTPRASTSSSLKDTVDRAAGSRKARQSGIHQHITSLWEQCAPKSCQSWHTLVKQSPVLAQCCSLCCHSGADKSRHDL